MEAENKKPKALLDFLEAQKNTKIIIGIDGNEIKNPRNHEIGFCENETLIYAKGKGWQLNKVKH